MNNLKSVEMNEYTEARENGELAEMNVFGVLRGGNFYNGSFYYSDARMLNKVESASSLKLSGVKIL